MHNERHRCILCEVNFGTPPSPPAMTSKRRDQAGEALETCVDIMLVRMMDDCPTGNILGFYLFLNSSSEASFMDRWPHLVWWNITWLWCTVGLVTTHWKLPGRQALGWGLGGSPGPSGFQPLGGVGTEETAEMGHMSCPHWELRKNCVNSVSWFASHGKVTFKICDLASSYCMPGIFL